MFPRCPEGTAAAAPRTLASFPWTPILPHQASMCRKLRSREAMEPASRDLLGCIRKGAHEAVTQRCLRDSNDSMHVMILNANLKISFFESRGRNLFFDWLSSTSRLDYCWDELLEPCRVMHGTPPFYVWIAVLDRPGM